MVYDSVGKVNGLGIDFFSGNHLFISQMRFPQQGFANFDLEVFKKNPSCQKFSISIEFPTIMKVSTNFKADLNNPGPHCRVGLLEPYPFGTRVSREKQFDEHLPIC